MHEGEMDSIIRFSDYIINRTNIIPFQFNGISGNKNRSSKVRHHVVFDNRASANCSQINLFTDPLDDLLEDETFPFKILDQFSAKYKEMQNCLNFIPEPNRKALLTYALFSSLRSYNPVGTLNKRLMVVRKVKDRVTLFNDLKEFLGIDRNYTVELLKSKFRSNRYYGQFNK